MPTRPSDSPDWATGTNYSSGPAIGTPNKDAPSGGQVIEGFEPSSRPPAQMHNWLWNNHAEWIKYAAPLYMQNELWLTSGSTSSTGTFTGTPYGAVITTAGTVDIGEHSVSGTGNGAQASAGAGIGDKALLYTGPSSTGNFIIGNNSIFSLEFQVSLSIAGAANFADFGAGCSTAVVDSTTPNILGVYLRKYSADADWYLTIGTGAATAYVSSGVAAVADPSYNNIKIDYYGSAVGNKVILTVDSANPVSLTNILTGNNAINAFMLSAKSLDVNSKSIRSSSYKLSIYQ